MPNNTLFSKKREKNVVYTQKIYQKVCRLKNNAYLCTRFEIQTKQKHIGALVQLVRISACHAGGHGFESRTHRKRVPKKFGTLFCLCLLLSLYITLSKHMAHRLTCKVWGKEVIFLMRAHLQKLGGYAKSLVNL